MTEQPEVAVGRIRLLAVYTHPVQYQAPLFRALAADPRIDFEVLYLTHPTPEQQGQGFGVAFRWDQDLMEGYRARVFREPLPQDDYTRWGGLDAPGIGKAIENARPDVVLLPGWNCRGLVRALIACNWLKIPVLYRGDTNLWQKPRGLRGLFWTVKNRFLLRRFAGFLAVGKRARLHLREHRVREDLVFDSPHSVDGDRIRRDAGDAMTPQGRRRARESLGLADEDFVVLFAGKLEPTKRPEDAIRAVAALGEHAVLVVCGAGALEPACRQIAAGTVARVIWLGFRNQRELPILYAAADAVVLPSVSETWGLVVNEAMAVGTPCVVSDAVGCSPDLVDPGVTGEIFPSTIISSLVEGLKRICELAGGNRALSPAVRTREAAYSLSASAEGIVHLACAAVSGRSTAEPRERRPGVLALCEGMAALGGMERRTMEILDYASSAGADVHCIVNHQPWFRYRIAHRAEQSGHSWSTAQVSTTMFTAHRSIGGALHNLRDIVLSSGKVLTTAIRSRSRVVFLWSFGSALTNWPALLILRGMGFTIILRSGSAPAVGARQRWIWKRLVDPVVDLHVAISEFISSEMLAIGIGPRKIRVIRNALPDGGVPKGGIAKVAKRVIYVGQVIPGKGILEFLDALILLQDRGIDFEAVLLGQFEGWEHAVHSGHKEAIRAKIAGLPVDAVKVLGEREDVLDVMRSASLHCCPSQEALREGLGNVVLEAKACGIPSVVTPSGALPEMVRHGVDGWVCRGFDAEAIAEGLAYFLGDPAACLRAGVQAAAWRHPAFLRKTVERQWRDLLCTGTAPSGLVPDGIPETAARATSDKV